MPHFLVKGSMWLPRKHKVVVSLLLVAVSLSGLPSPSGQAETGSTIRTSSYLSGVSCLAKDHCIAVGNYFDINQKEWPMIVTKQQGSWTVDNSLLPTLPTSYSDHSVRLNAVSCVTDFCATVGEYSAEGTQDDHPWIATYSGGQWSSAPLAWSGGKVNLLSISCSTSTFCLAGGQTIRGGVPAALAFAWQGETWTEVSADTVGFFAHGHIRSIDCVSVNHCTAVGLIGINQPVVAEYMDGEWSFNTLPEPRQSGFLYDITCFDEATCVVVGHDVQEHYFMAQGKQDTWEFWQAADMQVNTDDFNSWVATSCPTVHSCVMAGTSVYSSDTAARASIFIELNDSWEVVDVSPPESVWSLIGEITCTATDACTAVGSYWQADNQQRPLLIEFNGTDWQMSDPVPDNLASPPVASQSTGPAYVAFGDSITTGASIPTCKANRQVSPWGCTGTPLVKPYPERVAQVFGVMPTQFQRVGIWGYTVHEAAEARHTSRNHEGDWTPQLIAIENATELVTGSLGINDLRFSDVLFWAKRYYRPNGDHVTPAAQQLLSEREADFDQLFASLSRATHNGARVIVNLYYNPYDSSVRGCGDLEAIGYLLVDTLNDELERRAQAASLRVADLRPAFYDHGSGMAESFVFGNQCRTSTAIADWLPSWTGGGGGQEALAAGFDPHPNAVGSQAIADVITRELE